MTDNNNTDETTAVAKLLSDQRIGMLATRDEDGDLVSRPMAHQDVDFDGSLWFFAERGSRKVAHIRRDPRVLVAYSSTGTWVSLRGRATVVDDQSEIHALWNSAAEAWLPEGPDSPEAVLIRVDAESAEYWDTPGSKVATAVAFLKSKVRGERPDIGEHGKVELKG
ncbi:pyridoxamine 5'-phosphate oxidase family protein [Actinokineospora pegani]|uniref:pyridoxamine 5'-phosphate oxidase family protein n=1 Tax=Actinokineospora pegani TaxID=2654637 RepID=UPI0012EA2A78|nr:pyridoxamine 5'-phosphate oxidase family protein [Actinokineospora pegani]